MREACFDGLVGPTHSYAGLSAGNLASTTHRGRRSSPRQAALEGLAKMEKVRALGVSQGVLPPQERPQLALLRHLGFTGRDHELLAQAAREGPTVLAAACSASSMWAANAATVSPSADTRDGRVHFTPANLVHHLHRSIEAAETTRALRRIFADEARFFVHPPLPATLALGDEGAANHTRLEGEDGRGFALFVYGRADGEPGPRRYPARQTRAASEAVARSHGLSSERVLFARQAAEAIDAGVFHNDVIAVGHGRLWLQHERAFADDGLARALEQKLGGLELVVVPEARVSLPDAVTSYLFNSQIVTGADGRAHLFAPSEAEALPAVRDELARLTGGPLASVTYLPLRQSMRNGGGPACLRLRVPLTDAERAAVRPGVWLDDALAAALRAWVGRHYRDSLEPDDLRDPALLDESRAALDELTGLLGLGDDFYDFQKAYA